MDKAQLKAIIEALLFVSSEPLEIKELKELLEIKGENKEVKSSPEEAGADPADQLKEVQSQYDEEISRGDIKDAIEDIVKEYNDNPAKGFELVSVANGYQFRTKTHLSSYVKNLNRLPKPRLSTPAMETLAIVAYQQPVQRAKVEQIRGVDSGGVLKTLLDRDLLRVVGRSEEPGRPILYGTTKNFLSTFGLNSLSELPTLKDLESLDSSVGTGLGVKEEQPEEEQPEEEQPQYTSLDEESGHLIDDLENSVRNLKSLEKKMFPKENEENEESSDPKP